GWAPDTVSGSISNGTATSLAVVKNGTGLWQISGSNSYSGGTTVNNGTLLLNGGGNFSGGITINPGGVLAVQNSDANLGAAGNGITLNGGALRLATDPNLATLITLGASRPINVTAASQIWTYNAQPVIAGNITGTAPLTVVGNYGYGSGPLTLSGDNSGFSGGITAPGGSVLELHGPASSGAGPLNFPDQFTGETLNLRNDTSATFATPNVALGGWNALNISVDNVSTGTGNTLGLNSVTGNILSVLNVSGGHGYSLAIGTVTGGGNSLTLNASTANVAIATLNLGHLTWNNNLTLSGSATGNTIGNILFTGADGGDTPLSNAVNVTGGTWALTGASNYWVPTNISGGAIELAATGAVPSASAFIVNANNGILFGNGVTSVALTALSGSGNLALSTLDLHPVALAVGGNNQDATYSGSLSDAAAPGGSLTKAGTGALTLSGNNVYSGPTTILNGAIVLGSANALPANPPIILGDAVANTSGALELNGQSLTVTAAQVTVAGNGTNNRIAGGSTTTSALTMNVSSGSATFNAMLGGSGANEANMSFTKTGSGTLILTAFNNYLAGTTLASGVLQLNWLGTLGDPSAPLAVNAGLLDLGGSYQSVGAVTISAGTIQNGTLAAASYAVVNNSPVTVNAVLSGFSAGLSKSGSGTLTSNVIHGYAGGTSINGGKLVLGPMAGLGDTAITIGSGAIFAPHPATGGTIVAGNYAASLTVNPGGVFDMSGDGAMGTFAVNGAYAPSGCALTLNNATLAFDVGNGSYANDQLAVNDAYGTSLPVSISGTNTIRITGVGSLAPGGYYPLITDANGGLNTGSFVLANTSVTVGGQTYGLSLISNSYGTEEDLQVALAVGPQNHSALTLSTGTVTLNMHVGASGMPGVTTVTNSGADPGSFTASSTGSTLNFSPAVSGSLSASGGTAALSLGWVTTAAGSRSATLSITNNDNPSDASVPQSQAVQGYVYTGQGVWNAAGGNWSDFSKWTALGGVPGKDGPTLSATDTATFGAAGSQTVTLDLSPQLSALSLSSGPYTLTGAGTLHLSNTATGRATVTSAGAQGITAPVSLDSQANVTVTSGSLGVSGAISGPGGLVKNGTGLLNLNATPNSYQGGTTISAGILAIGNSSSLGAGGVTINGATLKTTGTVGLAQPVALNSLSSTIDPDGSSDVLTLAGLAGGSGGLTKIGGGKLVLSNTGNHAGGYAGGTTLAGGMLQYTSSSAVESGGIEFAGGNLVLNFGAGGGSVVTGADTASSPAVAVPSAAAPATAAGVPEPGTLGLLGAGLLAGLIAWLRRRR
ncbi:MAG: autotransporter-associated beta strand repeat-containing protein, partial [Thermoguttaceae bacterium]